MYSRRSVRFSPSIYLSRGNEILNVQVVGNLDFSGLKEKGVTSQDVVRAFIYQQEYMWNIMEPNDTANCIVVIDLHGISFFGMVCKVQRDFGCKVKLQKRIWLFINANFSLLFLYFLFPDERWFDVSLEGDRWCKFHFY